MNITTNRGDFSIDSIEKIMELFETSKKQQYDEIWISKEKEYPCLGILINGNYANVHFFLNDDGDAWQLLGDNEEDMEFMVNGQKQLIEGDYIISFDKMLDAVKEFCISDKILECFEWEEMWE